MNPVILVPTEKEAVFFFDHGLQAHICGVGMAECAAATAAAIVEERPDLIVLAGIAGAYSDGIATGETFVIESETVADLGRRNADGSFTPLYQKNYRATVMPEGFPTAHSNSVSTAGGLCVAGSLSTERRQAKPDGVVIENMEGAAFFAVCERLGIPAMEVRTVSNCVGQPITPAALELSTRRLARDLEKIIMELCV